tara:strand:+ start:50 stop:673 length:624 start_codon:yes stop_codon:yes gene_type:complete
MEKASENPILNRIYTLKGEPDEVRDAYKDWAQTYEKDTVEDMGYIAPAVVADKIAALMPDAKLVLDAGCGTGLAGVELSQRGFKTIDGMDISPDMLDMAREKEVYRNLQVEDMTGPLSYESNTYDAVSCVGTFTHAHVGPKGFNELLRITKPEGMVVATVHEDVWDDGYQEHFKALEAAGKARVTSIEDAAYHLHGCKLCVLQPLAP